MKFVHTILSLMLANGEKLKCLTLIDEFTKESLCIDVASSIKGKRVVQVSEGVIAERGYPKVLRSDNSPEFVSTTLVRVGCRARITQSAY